MKHVIKNLCNVVMLMAVMVQPVASGWCRFICYEEKEPKEVGQLKFRRK